MSKYINNNPVAKDIRKLPRLVWLICGTTKSWLVGSSADPNNNNPKDYDIAVPYEYWRNVALLIPKDAKPTLFGGWKFKSDGKVIDVWPDDVVNIFTCSKCEWMWQPQYDIRIKKMKQEDLALDRSLHAFSRKVSKSS